MFPFLPQAFFFPDQNVCGAGRRRGAEKTQTQPRQEPTCEQSVQIIYTECVLKLCVCCMCILHVGCV